MHVGAILFALGATVGVLSPLTGTSSTLAAVRASAPPVRQVLEVQLRAPEAEVARVRAVGRNDALRDIASGHLVVHTLGLVTSFERDDARAQEGIETRHMGCVVTEEILIYLDAYQETMTPVIERRLGREAMQRLELLPTPAPTGEVDDAAAGGGAIRVH